MSDSVLPYGMIQGVIPEVWDALSLMTIRGTIVLLVAWVVLRYWRRASAAQRYLVWLIACMGMLAVPAVRLVVPLWKAPVLPPVLSGDGIHGRDAERRLEMPAVGVYEETTLESESRMLVSSSSRNDETSRSAILFILWAIGGTIAFGTLIVSHGRARRSVQRSVVSTDPRILRLLDETKRSLRIRRIVSLRQHHTVIPMTYRTRAPVIVLPETVTTWSDDKLRDVLLHELAHVKRYDCFTQILVSIAGVIQWFNPFMWYGILQMRALREEACDNYVLASGTRPSRYATHLLDLLDTFRGNTPLLSPTAQFVRKTRIQQRLHAIMRASHARTQVGMRSVVLAVSIAMLLIIPLSAFTPVARPITLASDNTQPPVKMLMPATLGDFLSQTADDDVSRLHNSQPQTPKPSMMKRVMPLVAGALIAGAPLQAEANDSKMVSPDTITQGKVVLGDLDSIQQDSVRKVMRVSDLLKSRKEGSLIEQFRNTRDQEVLRISDLLKSRTRDSLTQQSRDIRIRRATQAKSPPLLIINGIRYPSLDGPVTDLLNSIDPNSIKSIDVLKGPSAVSIYGPDAEGGVIVIKTKDYVDQPSRNR